MGEARRQQSLSNPNPVDKLHRNKGFICPVHCYIPELAPSLASWMNEWMMHLSPPVFIQKGLKRQDHGDLWAVALLYGTHWAIQKMAILYGHADSQRPSALQHSVSVCVCPLSLWLAVSGSWHRWDRLQMGKRSCCTHWKKPSSSSRGHEIKIESLYPSQGLASSVADVPSWL